MKFIERQLSKCIAAITATIALSLCAIVAFWTEADYQQYSELAHMMAYIMLWTLWFLTTLKLGIKAWNRKEAA
ncbi:MAG: hypothetical protein N0C90_12995 [Candidatus Thiodiazotropha endolucinida]|nr:hypothetical protein [Candidatus Thiodiazotropha taylori]MCW4262278.1 hypothetical protein [Candidatus Thiodiazotropha endolucinida]